MCRPQEGGVLRTEFDAMQHALALWAMMQGVLSMHLQGRSVGMKSSCARFIEAA